LFSEEVIPEEKFILRALYQSSTRSTATAAIHSYPYD